MKPNFKRNLVLVLTLSFLAAIGLGVGQFFSFGDGKLHLVFCDVGQGDAVYIRTPQKQEILIDGGPNDKVLDCLSSHRPFYDQEIEMVILSHPEADHLTGLIEVFKRYQVDYFVTENLVSQTAVFEEFRRQASLEGAKILNPKAGDKIGLGETEINFYWPQSVLGQKDLWSKNFNPEQSKDKSANLNDYSLVLTLNYKNFGTFLSGDAESPILEKISNLGGQVTVFKVPHHGSKDAVSRTTLEVLNPKLAVISAGKGNRFGHPREETLKILRDLDIKILRTDQDGEVEIVSDGQKWWVK